MWVQVSRVMYHPPKYFKETKKPILAQTLGMEIEVLSRKSVFHIAFSIPVSC